MNAKCPLCGYDLRLKKDDYYKCNKCKLEVYKDNIDNIKDLKSYTVYALERFEYDVTSLEFCMIEKFKD